MQLVFLHVLYSELKFGYVVGFLLFGILVYQSIPNSSIDLMVKDTYYVIGYRIIWLVLWMAIGLTFIMKNKSRA